MAAEVLTDGVDSDRWAQLLEAPLVGRGLRPVFQPVVDLRHRTVAGYEALIRFEGDAGPAPLPYLEAAAQLGVGGELEAAILRAVLSYRSSVPRGCFLSVNVDPRYLIHRDVARVLRDAGSLRGVMVEFTEHGDWDPDDVRPAIELLREAGAIIALDDTGAGYAGLQQILKVRPAVLKLDRALVTDADIDEAKVAMIEMMGVLANRLDAWLIAEGIEQAGEVRRLVDLQVPLAQGFYFGRPDPPWAAVDGELLNTIEPFGEPEGDSLHRLLDPVPPLRSDEDADQWFDDGDRWRCVVDGSRRPVGLVSVNGSISIGLIANVTTSPRELAARLSASTIDANVPAVVVDERGGYLGVVGLRRLLAWLGSATVNEHDATSDGQVA